MKNLTLMAILFATIVSFSSCGNSATPQSSDSDSTLVHLDSTTGASDSISTKVDTAAHCADTVKH